MEASTEPCTYIPESMDASTEPCLLQPSPLQRPQDGVRSWLVLTWTTCCAFMAFVVSFGFGVFLPVLMDDFKESRERTVLVGSLMLGVTVFCCVIFCKLCEAYTCRIVAAFGTMSYATGLILSSFTQSIAVLYITYSLLNGLGAAATYSAVTIILKSYFNKWYTLAVGIHFAGSGIGMIVVGPFLQLLISSFDWRNAFRFISAPFVLLFLSVFILDPNVEAPMKTSPHNTGKSSPRQLSIIPRKIVLKVLDLSVWRFPEFTLCAVGASFSLFGHFTASLFLGQFSKELGNSPHQSSILFLYLGISSVLSRIISGRLCIVSFIKPRYVHQAGSILSGVSTILLAFTQTYTHLVIFAVFYGIADGAFQTTLVILFMNSVDLQRAPSAFGLANMVTSIPYAAGSSLAGLIADNTGSYLGSFIMAGCSTIIGGTIFFLHLCFNFQSTKATKSREEIERKNRTDSNEHLEVANTYL